MLHIYALHIVRIYVLYDIVLLERTHDSRNRYTVLWSIFYVVYYFCSVFAPAAIL